MRKYIEIAKYSTKTQLAFLINYFSSLASFAFHILIFNQLWDFILKDKSVVGYTRPELIWYIIIGEFFQYAFLGNNYKRISLLVKNGDIAYTLSKPVNFLLQIAAEEMSSIIKIVINLIFAIILGIFIAGPILFTFQSIIFIPLVFLLSLIISLLLQIILGLSAFWLEDNMAIYLVLNKLTLILVFTPIEFFPKIVQKIIMFLPTTHLTYSPSSLLVHFSYEKLLMTLGFQLSSIALLVFTCWIIYVKGVEKLNVNGG